MEPEERIAQLVAMMPEPPNPYPEEDTSDPQQAFTQGSVQRANLAVKEGWRPAPTVASLVKMIEKGRKRGHRVKVAEFAQYLHIAIRDSVEDADAAEIPTEV